MRNKLVMPLLFIIVVIGFFYPFYLSGKLPIPSDALVGLYHPYRDYFMEEYPRGYPFKNFLITDPFRQQYPWRSLSIDIAKRYQLPLWNPYVMAGIPLLANIQSAALYPLNILYFILPFSIAWSLLIFLQPVLAGVFLFLYARALSLHKFASFFGALAYAFSGFSISWLQWNTIGHVSLWLPLILLCIDKVFLFSSHKNIKIVARWSGVLLFALSASFFAGHLQTFFYLFLLQTSYVLVRLFGHKEKLRNLVVLCIVYAIFLIVTSIQWLPSLQLISLSARDIDLVWQKEGWFIPWQHLIQFIAPDFFGNPTTLNYWGVWNYGELVGYVGLFPLLIALYAMFQRRDKKTYYFTIIFGISLFLALPTFISKVPFLLNIPFISSAQPTRLLVLTDFALSVLATLGIDYFLKSKKDIWRTIAFISMLVLGFWMVLVTNGLGVFLLTAEQINIAKRNLYIPTLLLFLTSVLLLFYPLLSKKLKIVVLVLLFILTCFDLTRFAYKFLPFTEERFLFPSTEAITYLQKNIGNSRFMTVDDRILPPNVNIVHKISSVSGYDPLYLREYGELIAASERGIPDIRAPFGFNRIINPKNYDSTIMDVLGVKYVLALEEISSSKLEKVFQEGETRIYFNKEVFPKAFFVNKIYVAKSKDDSIKSVFRYSNSLRNVAIVHDNRDNYLRNVKSFAEKNLSKGEAEITTYQENKVVIRTKNQSEGFLVLTDVWYPSWKVMVDNNVSEIYKTNYILRGVFVPAGMHTITFYTSLF